jgi:TM2 domain-containing membrane protein YozV
MYSILGADQRVYGPATLDQIRQWIFEGRANAFTQVNVAGSPEWRSLGSIPELAAMLPPTPPPQIIGPARRSKLAAGLLGILLGAWGIHRFYLGYIGVGIAQILVTICTCGIGALWGVIEGILILAGTSITTDAQGRPLQD